MDNNWKLVPVEPTEEMIIAFAETWFSRKRCIDDCEMEDCYRAMIAAAPAPDNNGHDEFVMVRKSDLCKAAACLMLPDNGVTDTVWFANGCTLFEHLVGLAGIDDLTADVDADYARLSGKPLPPPPALDKGE